MKKYFKYLFIAPVCLTTILPITSCGCTLTDPIKDTIPVDKLKIDDGVLSGFVDGFNPTEYKSLVIPDKVYKISANAFNGKFKGLECKLNKIVIPSSVKSIESKAFYDNNAILQYDLSSFNNVDGYYWAEDAFGACAEVGSIIYPTTNDDYLNNLIDYLICDAGLTLGWFDTTKVRNVNSIYFNINDQAELLGFTPSYYSTPHHALFNKLVVPSYVKKIGNNAFYDATNENSKIENILYVEFAVDDTSKTSLANIGDYAFAKSNIKNELIFPFGIETIGNSAFTGCTSLTSVEFYEGVKSIGISAFEHCSGLTQLTFPSTVEKLGLNTFSDCSKVNYINVDKVGKVPSGWDATSTTWSGLATNGSIICNPTLSTTWSTYFYSGGIDLTKWTITDKLDLMQPFTPSMTPIQVSEAKTAEEIEEIYYTSLQYYPEILSDDIYFSLSKWISNQDVFNFTKFRVRVENPTSLKSESTISFIMYYDIEGTVVASATPFSITNGYVKFRDIPFKSLTITQQGTERDPYKSLVCPGFATMSDEWLVKAIENDTTVCKLDIDSIDTKTFPLTFDNAGILMGLNWFINKPATDKCFNLYSSYLSKIEIK